MDEHMKDLNWQLREQQSGKGGKGGKGKDGSVLLEDKHFKGVEKFEGTGGAAGGDWPGWTFNLVTQMAGVSGLVAKCMDDILRDKDKEVSEKKKRVEEVEGEEGVEGWGGEG